jgi:molecular chaperone GrpE
MGKKEHDGYKIEIPDDAVQAALDSVERIKQSKKTDAEEEESTIVTVEVDSDQEETDETREATSGAETEELKRALEEAQGEVKAIKDRMLRIAADADNQRKRLQREKEETIKFGRESLLTDLLPPLDNLERTLDHVPDDSDDPVLKSFREGLQMVLRQFNEVLGKYNVVSFSSMGELFDPNLHEAINRIETDEHPPNTIVSEMQRGYMIHDRLLRPALVSVAYQSNRPAANVDSNGSNTTDEDTNTSEFAQDDE